MEYPTRNDLDDLWDIFDCYKKNNNLYRYEFKKHMIEFMDKFGDYTLSLLESDIIHTETTQEATLPTLQDISDRMDSRKKAF